MPLNDSQIKTLALQENMLDPFIPMTVRNGAISYGLSSFGYDIRLGNEIHLYRPVDEEPGVIDPKKFNPELLYTFTFKEVDTFIMPPHSYALGYSVERFKMPADVIGICTGKSTYARCGIIVNVTPLEPAWEGHLTIELANLTPKQVVIYVGEGIAQIVFHRGDRPSISYARKNGKYQGQGARPVLPIVETPEDHVRYPDMPGLGTQDGFIIGGRFA